MPPLILTPLETDTYYTHPLQLVRPKAYIKQSTWSLGLCNFAGNRVASRNLLGLMFKPALLPIYNAHEVAKG